jgi:hypothetical protein
MTHGMACDCRARIMYVRSCVKVSTTTWKPAGIEEKRKHNTHIQASMSLESDAHNHNKCTEIETTIPLEEKFFDFYRLDHCLSNHAQYDYLE